MKRLALLTLALALAAPSLADNPPMSQFVYSNGDGTSTRGGTLCSAQTATATGCTGTVNGVSDELVADLRGFSTITLDSTASTATSYTCDLYTSALGYDGDSGAGQDRTTTALTETQQTVGLSDGGRSFVWVECSAISGGSVTISFVATK